MKPLRRTRAVQPEPAEADSALIEDLTSLYAVAAPAPALPAVPAHAHPAASRRHVRRRLLPGGLIGLAAAAAVAAVLLLPPILGSSNDTASAQSLFDQSQQAALTSVSSGAQSYHLVATSESPKGAIRSETWFQDPTHVRAETTTPDGETSGTLLAGTDLWLWRAGRAVHAAGSSSWNSAFGTQPGTESGSGQASLADVLGSFAISGCQAAHQQGEATVAGRKAYVIAVEPMSSTCSNSKLRGGGSIQAQGQGTPIVWAQGTLTVWIDEQTALPLRTESRDQEGNVLFTYAVSELTVDPSFPAGTFSFEPSASTVVTEVSSPEQAKGALGGGPQGSPANGKLPENKLLGTPVK